MSIPQEPLEIEVTAADAFWLMRFFDQTAFDVVPDFIVGNPNHLQLRTSVGPVSLVGRVWTDGASPKWTIEFDRVPA